MEGVMDIDYLDIRQTSTQSHPAAGQDARPRYASILVYADDESAASDGRVCMAVDLARRFHASLVGIGARGIRPPLVDAYGGMVVIDAIMDAEEDSARAHVEAARRRFEALTRATELDVSWRGEIASPAEFVTRVARAVDLIVLGRDESRLRAGAFRAADPGDVVMEAARPVLVVPPAASELLAERIVVGWKDSREARRAVFDALPFLTRASSVLVIEVAPPGEHEAAAAGVADVVNYLKRHGVTAHGQARTLHAASHAEALLAAADEFDADLIVAGAYGHARLREWIFGGVTADLLARSPKCCLLSH
jgi:nucleotide-binding universal stress UspA family protein